MAKKVMLFVGAFLLVSAYAHAAEQYSISGQVTFSWQGDIYLGIYTLEELANYKESLPSPPFSQKITPNPEQIKAGRFSFTLSGVPKGTYCFIAFQDVDNNGRMTCSTWGGIKEPICCYKGLGAEYPNWHKMKFELASDITGIIMKLD